MHTGSSEAKLDSGQKIFVDALRSRSKLNLRSRPADELVQILHQQCNEVRVESLVKVPVKLKLKLGEELNRL